MLIVPPKKRRILCMLTDENETYLSCSFTKHEILQVDNDIQAKACLEGIL